MLARVFLSVSVLFFALGLALHYSHAKPAPAPVEKAKVLVLETHPTDDTHRLLVPALVEARVSSLVTAEVEGLVIKIKKPLGSQVKAGDVVMYVKNADPSFTYAAVPVRAPVAGVVSQLMPALMTRVNRGDRLFTVMNPQSLKITAEIPGSDLAYIKPGSLGSFKQDLAQPTGIPIRVTGISPLVDARTGTAAAELEFVPPQTKKELKGGKTAQAAAPAPGLPAIGSVGHALFETSLGQVLLIPESSLGYSDGKPMVKVIDSAGLVKRKPVVLGEQRESLLVVKSGLDAGEKLIVRANRSIKEGESVDVESPEKHGN
jgi:multidrug efflux pump subunit AcrA (membrane-fusion protein)